MIVLLSDTWNSKVPEGELLGMDSYHLIRIVSFVKRCRVVWVDGGDRNITMQLYLTPIMIHFKMALAADFHVFFSIKFFFKKI